jgi:hypothetical protein
MKLDKKKLVEDLKAAKAAAELVAMRSDDGGTCNFDSAMLDVKGARERDVMEAIEEAGLHGYRHSGGWMWKGMYSLSAPVFGQGNCRTVQAEKMALELRERGWKTSVYYQMD